jgi:hypothetical protein
MNAQQNDGQSSASAKTGGQKTASKEVRLVLPPNGSSNAELESIVDQWLVPRLVDEYLFEHGLLDQGD